MEMNPVSWGGERGGLPGLGARGGRGSPPSDPCFERDDTLLPPAPQMKSLGPGSPPARQSLAPHGLAFGKSWSRSATCLVPCSPQPLKWL